MAVLRSGRRFSLVPSAEVRAFPRHMACAFRRSRKAFRDAPEHLTRLVPTLILRRRRRRFSCFVSVVYGGRRQKSLSSCSALQRAFDQPRNAVRLAPKYATWRLHTAYFVSGGGLCRDHAFIAVSRARAGNIP